MSFRRGRERNTFKGKTLQDFCTTHSQFHSHAATHNHPSPHVHAHRNFGINFGRTTNRPMSVCCLL